MAHMDEPDELLDLVDEHDQKIGTIVREDITKLIAGRPGFVRAVGILVVNSRGELWIPRRGLHKKIAPGGLDFSAGEHVQSGETYEQAAVRGMAEELHLTATPTQLRHIGTLPPVMKGIPYFEAIFTCRANEVPDYSQDDYVSYEWLEPEALRERLVQGSTAKKGLLPAVELFLEYNRNVKE